jgi:hypothetical protein
MVSAFLTYIKLRHSSFSESMFAIVGRYLRMAPLYYMVFLYGWLISSQLQSDSPWWYTYEMGFENCPAYYWSVFTMTINEFPSFMVANEGCFFWGWVVACEMQIMLVIPFIIRALEAVGNEKSSLMRKNLGDLLCFFLLGVGILINYRIIYNNSLSVALFDPENILIFKFFINKAYSKITPVALGLLAARWFLRINEYKKSGWYVRKSTGM